MNLGKAIKLCRIQRELTQKSLADLASLSTSYVSMIEANQRDPSISTVCSLAKLLNVPLVVLMFLAADDEMESLDPVLREKLAAAALLPML